MDKNFRTRLGISFLLIAALGLGVLVRAGLLMLTPSERLQTAMNRQFRQEPPRMPRRGYILDRNHESMAVSNEVRSLFANPGKVKDRYQAALLLAQPLGLSPAMIRARLKAEKAFVWIKRQLSEAEERDVEELLDRHPTLSLAFGLAKESRRFYPNRGLASQLMGFTGLDSNGLEGLELYYEKEMAGLAGGKAPSDGHTLVVTIDKALQYTLEEELARGLRETGGVAGTAIILDAGNGDVIAMASAPSFNGNEFGKSNADQRRNRSVTDTYEPGSVMKPLLVAGGLEAGVLQARTRVFCEYGKLQIGKHWVNESEAKEKWGWLELGEVLQHSSNIGATKIGFLVGQDRMYQWYRQLGFAERTGVDLPGEQGGVLARPEKWSKILHSNLSFGQGLAVTPLQVVRAFAAIANGGTLVTPRLVREIRSFEGELLREIPPGPRRKVMERKTVALLEKMLLPVATEAGTAPKAAIPGFAVVGKTGTSQKPVPGRGYRSGKYMSSFVGYVKGVSLRYVGYVMIDEPKYPYFGGETAAPIFRKLMTAALAREGVAPDPALAPFGLLGEKPPEGRAADSARVVSAAPAKPAVLEASDENWLMPDLSGLSAREVMELFSGKELQLQLKGAGQVHRQSPSPGALLRRGESVVVLLERELSIP